MWDHVCINSQIQICLTNEKRVLTSKLSKAVKKIKSLLDRRDLKSKVDVSPLDCLRCFLAGICLIFPKNFEWCNFSLPQELAPVGTVLASRGCVH